MNPPPESRVITGIVGSRGFREPNRVKRFVSKLADKHPGAVIVSGGARDVDRVAEDAALEIGLDVISFRPYGYDGMSGRQEWSIETLTWGEQAQAIVTEGGYRINSPYFFGFAGAALRRNSWIVDLAEHVVAFWDGRSTGTWDSISKAHAAGKLALVAPNESAVIAGLRLQLSATPELKKTIKRS